MRARSEGVSRLLRALVESAQLEGIRRPDFAREQSLVKLLYEPTAYAPQWLDDDRPSARAREAIAVLASTDAKGLEPDDYDADILAASAERLGESRGVSRSDLVRFEVALSVALVRLIIDIHIGRVDPRALGFNYDVAPKTADLTALVSAVVTRGRVRDAVEEAEPHLVENLLLEQQLGRYRRLVADPAVVPVRLQPPIRPGIRSEAAPDLARWLTGKSVV